MCNVFEGFEIDFLPTQYTVNGSSTHVDCTHATTAVQCVCLLPVYLVNYLPPVLVHVLVHSIFSFLISLRSLDFGSDFPIKKKSCSQLNSALCRYFSSSITKEF